jgi:hypothetical protein
MASPLTPYVEKPRTSIMPMVEVGCNTIKTKVEESVIPHSPDGVSKKVKASMSTAVRNITAAVDKVDTLACRGFDQLTEKVPALKGETPELMKNSKETITSYFSLATSFSYAQVALKIIDSGLDIVEDVVKLSGGSEEGTTWSSIRNFHNVANTIRFNGNKTAGSIKARKIEEASFLWSFG